MRAGMLLTIVAVGLFVGTPTTLAASGFVINLWPNGRVPYRFADALDTDWFGDPAIALSKAQETAVRTEMDNWQEAMRVRDPANLARSERYVRFVPCAGRCESESNYLLIRLNNDTRTNKKGKLVETNNMCGWRDQNGKDQPGRNPNGVSVLHFSPREDANTLRHELGHCLGLWHEFGRPDRDAWLEERPDADGVEAWDDQFATRGVEMTEMPELGNYDYDSIMHYGSVKSIDGVCVVEWTDPLGNMFNRRGLDAAPADGVCRTFPPGFGGAIDDQVSARDKSRVLQYYAREAMPNWGFFQSLNTRADLDDPDARPDPFLRAGVEARGTPAVAFQSSGNYDVFVRGSDLHLYWKSFRRRWPLFEQVFFDEVGDWTSLGCCFGSDPSAISKSNGEVDVVAISAFSGRPRRNHLLDGRWEGWTNVNGSVPVGGVKQISGVFYVGPAIVSRTPDTIDVFIVRDDGRLAVTTLNAGQWGPWRTLGNGYSVSARPAAVALSSRRVRLAINVSDVNLYEPLVTFASPDPPSFELGAITATTAERAAPALTPRDSVSAPYRVLIVTPDNRIAHKFAGGAWRDIGGIPKPETGVSATGSGAFSALIVMNGEDVIGCSRTCLDGQPSPGGFIQRGGLWLREFK